MRNRTVVGPCVFRGTLRPPGDKSITHRALLLGAIAEGETIIRDPLSGADCRATGAAMHALGADVDMASKEWRVVGVGERGLRTPKTPLIDVGNSGTSIRLLAGLCASYPLNVTLTGDESIRRRPMGRVMEPLRKMGAHIDGAVGGATAPLSIRGGSLRGCEHVLPIASAQVKSALLLAGLRADGTTTVFEPAQSRDHTERMLIPFHGTLERIAPYGVSVRGGQLLRGTTVNVPADISSAAFALVGAILAPGSDLILQDVGINPTRAGILAVLTRMGAPFVNSWSAEHPHGEPLANLHIVSKVLAAATVDTQEVPTLIDEVPILALAAARAEGMTAFNDVGELRVKESDRIAGIVRLLTTLGVRTEEGKDWLKVFGARTAWKPFTFNSHGDHRLAMTAAIAACLTPGESTIEDVDCIETSYPNFWQDLAQVTEKR